MSFWLDDYRQLLSVLRSAGRQLQPVADFLRVPQPAAAVLRHDVDRRPAQAMRMATAEAGAGVRATYYFRCDAAGTFPAEACRRVAQLGHEVGYHYEDLARCRGDRPRARDEFRRHLAALRAIAPCRTVSMHGSPLSRYDNGQLLEPADFSECDLLGDATASVQPHLPVYFTDAGGSWNDPRVNFRDRVGLMPEGADPLIPSVLSACLAEHPTRVLYFNLHPERWSADLLQFGLSLALDWGAAAAKRLLRVTRT